MDLNPRTPECQEGHGGKETSGWLCSPLSPQRPASSEGGWWGLAPDPRCQQGSRLRTSKNQPAPG